MFKNKGLSGRAGPFFGLPGAIFYLKFSLKFHKLRFACCHLSLYLFFVRQSNGNAVHFLPLYAD
ncbi:hypothetical protein C3V36_05460 [Lachnospiraceae bacterium oral taxon 500]|nr:hypothetical protein C3V36_05460 [Lachnospiraceae bacterium oral taxon 500]